MVGVEVVVAGTDADHSAPVGGALATVVPRTIEVLGTGDEQAVDEACTAGCGALVGNRSGHHEGCGWCDGCGRHG